METKTDAELIADAEKLPREYAFGAVARANASLAIELAKRLKAANELGEQILGNIKGLLCERDEGAPTERNLELAKLIVEWDKRSDDGVRNG